MVTNFYRSYLKSDAWKKKRQQVFAYYGKRCYACRKAPKVLHVHHLTYARLGRESVKDLIPLCVPCHREVTKVYKRNRRRGLSRVTMEFVKFKRAEVPKKKSN
jgi:5-methylcytosine-specific restriction endonuclease McrA